MLWSTTSFLDVATRASQLWLQLDPSARNRFREQRVMATHRRSEKPKAWPEVVKEETSDRMIELSNQSQVYCSSIILLALVLGSSPHLKPWQIMYSIFSSTWTIKHMECYNSLVSTKLWRWPKMRSGSWILLVSAGTATITFARYKRPSAFVAVHVGFSERSVFQNPVFYHSSSWFSIIFRSFQ